MFIYIHLKNNIWLKGLTENSLKLVGVLSLDTIYWPITWFAKKCFNTINTGHINVTTFRYLLKKKKINYTT